MNRWICGQIILVMLLWAGCFPLLTVGIQYAPHLTFAGLRAILAGLALTALALILRRPFPSRKLWPKLTLIGLGATTFGFLGMFHAAEFVSPGIATVIASTQPLLAAVLASFVLNERVNLMGKSGLAVGFFGIIVIVAPQLYYDYQDSYVVGILYIAIAAVGITVSNVVIKQIAGSVDALMAMGLQLLIGSIPLFLMGWAFEDPMTTQISVTFLVILLALSLLGTALAYWLWFSALENVPLNRANSFSFLVPIFGISIAAVFYGETIAWYQILGIVMTVAGISIVNRGNAAL